MCNYGSSDSRRKMASQKPIILVKKITKINLNLFLILALDEYNSMSNIGSSALSLCCKDLTNGYISFSERSTSSCSIKEDLRGTAVTAISRSYMNSLTSQKDVQVKKKEEVQIQKQEKPKFCLFAFFCL